MWNVIQDFQCSVETLGFSSHKEKVKQYITLASEHLHLQS